MKRFYIDELEHHSYYKTYIFIWTRFKYFFYAFQIKGMELKLNKVN